LTHEWVRAVFEEHRFLKNYVLSYLTENKATLPSVVMTDPLKKSGMNHLVSV
jgi:hypothetical protein